MKEKTLVLAEFTGKELTHGKIFDTTSERVAKENGLYRENAIFGPLPIIVGHGDVIPGLDEAMKEMKEGETRKLRLAAPKAFGERNKDLIVIVPLKEFHSRNIKPLPGLVVDLNGNYGRVQTVSGGRVRVDMNSDLAGKEVEYELKIVREIKEDKEKAQLLAEKFFPLKQKPETRIENETLKVKLPKEAAKQLAPLIAPFTKTVKDVMPHIKSVELDENFAEKPAAKEPEKAKGKD